MEEARNGFGGEIDAFDPAKTNAEDGAAAEGDHDDVTGEEFEVGRISQGATAAAINLRRNYLEKHRVIIA